MKWLINFVLGMALGKVAVREAKKSFPKEESLVGDEANRRYQQRQIEYALYQKALRGEL
jgi:hypothetical protein